MSKVRMNAMRKIVHDTYVLAASATDSAGATLAAFFLSQ
jgi:hypothetical protein